MSKRKYDGEPIDASWNDPPWAGDGETVDVIDSGDGEVSVDFEGEELFPEPWEPTEEQVARARWLLLNTDISGTKLADRIGIGQSTLSKYVRGETGVNPDSPPPLAAGKGVKEYSVRDPQRIDNTTMPGTKGSIVSERDVIQLRKRLVDGSNCYELADEYDLDRRTLQKYASGDKRIDPDEIEIEYKNQSGGWVRSNQSDPEQAELPDDNSEEKQDRQRDAVHVTPTEREQPQPDGRESIPVVVGFVLGVVFSAIVRWLR